MRITSRIGGSQACGRTFLRYATVFVVTFAAEPRADEPTLFFEDLTPGRTFDLGTLLIDEAEMVAFAMRFDPQWYHVDRPRAEASRWGRLIASGFFTVSALMRMYVDGVLTRAAADTSPGMENLRWLAPVFAGDELAAVLTVTDAQPSSRSTELGTVFLQWQMYRGKELVLQMSGRGWFVRRIPLRREP